MYRQALFKEHAGQTKAGGLTVRIFVYEQAPARLLKIRLWWYAEMEVTKPEISCAVRYAR